MGRVQSSLFPFLFFLLITLSQLHFTTSKPSDLGLKLIHRDSLESPLYPGKLTLRERGTRYSKFSVARLSQIESLKNHNGMLEPNLIRPPVLIDNLLYMVQLEIGTPGQNTFLALDTGGNLIWSQCLPCKNCYRQTVPIFDPLKSSTYQKLPCSHESCKHTPCNEGGCHYTVEYMNSAMTRGFLSTESFVFLDAKKQKATIPKVVFGCSNEASGFPFVLTGRISGVLGMSLGSLSLISQLSDYTQNRFSYCLVSPLSPNVTSTYLRFGYEDIGVIGEGFQSTPFVKLENPYFYAVNLVDITVAGKRLNFPSGTFSVKPNGSGGCIFDSGAPFSILQKDAYDKVEETLVEYFENFGLQRADHDIICSIEDETLCYYLPDDFNKFPSMTFHFREADLEVKPENVFYISRDEEYFFLGVKRSTDTNLIGAWQQHDTLFVHALDAFGGSLSFRPLDCASYTF
ncbi:Xylanase inhibitor, C-terminal [Dillenia turbinata]|uniref:Xylanase inhibitor, C-terminal n=1 Tax=Dillenia turbinata TaxID=194707 RepID=A0AAN8ZBN7_9MAGN